MLTVHEKLSTVRTRIMAWEEYSSGLLSLIKDFVLRKGRLGFMENTLTFTSLILRMTLGI